MGANAAASKGLAVLSNVEENKSVSHALARLSEVEEKVGQLHQQQYREDLFLITETIKDYVGLMNSVRVSGPERLFLLLFSSPVGSSYCLVAQWALVFGIIRKA